MMTTRLLIVAVAVLLALPGCGGSSAEVQVAATQYRPAPQTASAYASRQGWKKGDEPAGPGGQESPVDEPSDPGTTSPGETIGETTDDPSTEPGENAVVAGIDNPGGTSAPTDPPTTTTDPDPMPEPGTPTEPEPSGLAPADGALVPTHELLAGKWRGEPKHYVAEKEEWVDDGKLFIVEFREVPDMEGNMVNAVQISVEVDGVLQRQEPVAYRIDEEQKAALFGLGNQTVTIRVVEKSRLEVRGQERGFTVVRYFKRILG